MTFNKQGKPQAEIGAETPVSVILTRWPETSTVFRRYRMSCIGCYMSIFDTLEDAAAVYDIPIKNIVAALNERVSLAKFENMESSHE